MSIVSNLSNSVRARYINAYTKGVENRKLYELMCQPISVDKEVLQNSSSVSTPYLSDMNITAQTVSETVDIPAQNLRDANTSITPTSRGDAIQDSEKLLLENYTDYGAARFEKLGQNMVATLESLIIDSAMSGSLVMRAEARATMDAEDTTSRLMDNDFFEAANTLKEMGCPQIQQDGINAPNGMMAIMHPDAYYDLLSAGLIDDIASYQDKQIWMNGALGTLNGFQIISSPFAKVFMGAGESHVTGGEYTTSAAAEALAKTVSITTGTHVALGRYLNFGTEETGTDYYPTNERLKHVSGTATSIIVGGGANGGLKYDHASGTAINNNDSVYPVLFGGPNSLAKIFAPDVGEFGEVIGPKRDGLLDQFVSLGWKWYGAYAIMNENWLVRGEYSSSLDNVA